MRHLCGVSLAALVALPLAAQVPALPTAGAPAIQFSGELGSFGELYRRIGTPGRRPGETGRVFLNANAVLFGSVHVGVDLLASTEDGTSLGYGGLPGRQNVSQLGLHPQWAWGRAHLGAFNDAYSPYTYGGVQLSGAAFDVRAGPLRLGAFGGRAAGAIAGGVTTGSYRRSMAGGRLGVGRISAGRPSTFFDVIVVRAWDDPNSLPPVDTTLPPNAPILNPQAVTPEENLVVAGMGGVSLLEGRLAWRGELAAAVHTRDRRATALDEDQVDMPGILRGLITPRVGTHVDHAFSSELQLRVPRLPGGTPVAPRTLTATLSYRYVGPGYTSLGVASLGSDVKALEARANVRFSRWSAQLTGGRQTDNLIGQKLHTTIRDRLGGSFTLRATRAWNATLRLSLLTMGNGSADTLQWMDYTAWSVGMAHAISFGPRRRVETVTFDYTHQNAGDANPRRRSTTFVSDAVTARLAIRVGPSLQVSPLAGVTRSQSDTAAWQTRATYGAGAAWRVLDGRLATSGSLTRNKYGRSNTWTGTLDSRFQLSRQDELVLRVQYNRFRDTAGAGSWYNEQTVSLRWGRRF